MSNSPLEFMKGRRNIFEKKLEEIASLKLMEESGFDLTPDDSDLLSSEDEIINVIEEYNILFKELDEYKMNHLQISDNEMKDVVEIVYVGSLLDNSSVDDLLMDMNLKAKSSKSFDDITKEEKLYLSEVNKHFLAYESDKRTHKEALQDCLGKLISITDSPQEYDKLQKVFDKIVMHRSFNAAPDDVTRLRMQKMEWCGGTLKTWLEKHRDDVINEFTLVLGGKVHKTLRLKDVARYILRRVVKKIMHSCRENVCYGNLNTSNVNMEPNFDVKFLNPLVGRNSKSRKTDMNSIMDITKEMVGHHIESRPPDVNHFLSLLKRSRINDDIIFNHPCLWTPTETIQNLILCRTMMSASPTTHTAWTQTALIQEESSDWMKDLSHNVFYQTTFKKWLSELMRKMEPPPPAVLPFLTGAPRGKGREYIGHPGLLKYYRACFSHLYTNKSDQTCNLRAKHKDPGSQPELSVSILKTEEELHTVFPNYVSGFVEMNQEQNLILDIIKSEY